ncbi:MAG: tail fiber protein [Ferruginibacter sp.]|nr:tail fiber protein [Ferruginibacter sp.]
MIKVFLLLMLFVSSTLFAQNVGIGITPPTNRLHVFSAADPLRLEGLQSGTSTDSILTVTNTGVLKRRSNLVIGNGWSLAGNTATNPATAFLGTTDKIAFSIRTNNLRSAFLDPDSSKRNNAFGYRALNTAITGEGNTAIGFLSLSKITSGIYNISIGDSASWNLTSGFNNIAIGADALATVATASGNIAIGSNALKNTVSSENIAIGNQALANNNVGSNLLAIGANALLNNQTNFTQLAIGNNALSQTNAGLENVAIGYNAGTSLVTASYNVLLGHYAFSSASNASNNTILGHNAGLAYTATGNTNNTFLGYQAGFSQTTGTGNTYIGANVDLPTVVSISNSTGLGQGVQITASNQVRVGNTSVSSIGGQVGWSTLSDARIKANIKEDVHGLDFIMRLRPVTYNYDLEKLQRLQGVQKINYKTDAAFEQLRFSGFLAQEVQQAADAAHYDFSGVDKPSNEHTAYGLRYAELVVPLVKAMQEMKAMLDQQQKEIEQLKKLLEAR